MALLTNNVNWLLTKKKKFAKQGRRRSKTETSRRDDMDSQDVEEDDMIWIAKPGRREKDESD